MPPTADPIKVLVVDDHPIVREGLSAIIATQPDMTMVGEVASALDAVAQYREKKPTVVLMDLLLPDSSGITAIREICGKEPDARILVLTTAAGDDDIYRAIEAGARGYLLKDMVIQELVEAIRQVHKGRRYIPAQIGNALAEGLPRPGITSREIEVLRLVASGLKNKEIAFDLGLSEGTVNVHIKSILGKLSASDRTQAAMIALRRGIIRI